MKTQREVVEYCLSLPGTYLDHPFNSETPVLRHTGNRRIFALFVRREGQLLFNLKCEPMQADFWRGVYTGVIPGYHMNKTHWNSIVLGGDVPDAGLREMICHSYALTRPKQAAAEK